MLPAGVAALAAPGAPAPNPQLSSGEARTMPQQPTLLLLPSACTAQHSSRSAVAALPCCWSLTLPCLLRLQGLAWSLAETMAAAVAAVALLLAA